MNYKLSCLNEANSIEEKLKRDPLSLPVLKNYLDLLHKAGHHQRMYTEYLIRSKNLSGNDLIDVNQFAQDRLGYNLIFSLNNKKSNDQKFIRFFEFYVRNSRFLLIVFIFIYALLHYQKLKKEQKNKLESEKMDDSKPNPNTSYINKLQIGGIFNEAVRPELNLSERFNDVVGVDEFRAELEEIVDYLRNPKKYTSVGAAFPKGILLSGPPGTGKTLIARAIAGEANCSFYYKSGSQFDQMFRGSGKQNVKALFAAAKVNSPAIIFIDEIDSVAGSRSKRGGGRTNTINQLLTELDGFQKNDNVIFIAATNLEDSLDPAIMRSGRIDKVIRIPLPDIGGREKIISYYINKIKSKKLDTSTMAKRTIGFSGADLKNYINTAILHAVRSNKNEADSSDFDYAYDRIHMGVRRKNPLLNKEKRIETAVRHIGQALTSYYTDASKKFYKVTILPSGSTLGHISMMPSKDELSSSRKHILAQIDVSIAGTAAEEIFFGEDRTTTACSRELEKASNLVYFYVRDMGMVDDKLFINEEQDKMSDAYRFKTDLLVQSILEDSLSRTKRILSSRRKEMEILVEYLIEKETLTFDEFESILKKGKI